MNLTSEEIKNQFSYAYSSINQFEVLLESCLESDVETNVVIGKELLIAFEELKRML